MASKHSAKLDEDKLRFACDLLYRVHGANAIRMLKTAILIMQFGSISLQDMADWIENTGGER
jgi:hypothetical protein